MIDLSQSTLAVLFLYSVLLGIMLGVLYDVIRFIKVLLGIVAVGSSFCEKITPRRIISGALVLAFDIIFWVIFAVSSLILTYNISGGVFRGMVYFGMLAGGALYYLTIGKLTLKLISWAAKLIRRAARGVLCAMLVPLRSIFCLLIKIYHLTIGKIIGKIICVTKARRIARASESENALPLPQNIQKENDRDVTKYRYEREGRISFGRTGDKR